MYDLLGLLQVTALSDIPVDLQDGDGVPLFITDQHLAAFHDHTASVPSCMREFPFPLPFVFEVRIDVGAAARKACLEQAMGDAALRLLHCPAIELLGSPVPGDHTTDGITDENRIVREINQFGLQANLLQLLEMFMLGDALCGHISNSSNNMQYIIEQQGVQADLRRKFRAILAPPDEFQPYSHRSSVREGEIQLSAVDVLNKMALQDNYFKMLRNQLGL